MTALNLPQLGLYRSTQCQAHGQGGDWIEKVDVEDVTFITDENGKIMPKGVLTLKACLSLPEEPCLFPAKAFPPQECSFYSGVRFKNRTAAQ
jgi:hypothetical protein